MQEMVERHLKLGENKTPNAAIKLYADTINHYKDGKVSKQFILKSKRQFFDKWSTRKYTLMSPATVLAYPNTYRVYFSYEYYIKNKKKALVGKAWNELNVQIKNNRPVIIKENGGAFPNTRKIKKMWRAKESFSIENMIPVFMSGGELAYYFSVRFSQRGRCCEVGGILLRPRLNQAKEIKGLFSTVKSFDLDGDGISELETEGAYTGQGYTKGRKKLGFFNNWKFVELKRSEFRDNLGVCRSEKDYDKLKTDCYSKTVSWKYIDLNQDGILDLKETATEIIWNWKKNIKKDIVVKEYVFKNKKLIGH
jgi:hypothetical protein